MTAPHPDQATPYERMGGAAFFADLLHEFYAGVGSDPVLRAMYPEPDLGPAQRRFRLFLEQYWGGPTTYQQERGHPRLRLRHAPFVIDKAARDRWLGHMTRALELTAARHRLAPDLHEAMTAYFATGSTAMINAEPPTGSPNVAAGPDVGAGS